MNGRKSVRNLLSVIWTAVFVWIFCSMAMAASVTARIPVSQIFESNRPLVGNRFQYVLEAVTADAPMPVGSQDGKYVFTMKGDTEIELLIEGENYVSAEYRIYQLVDEEKPYYSYDGAVYKVFLTFYVDNNGEASFALMIENGKGEKAEEAHFYNEYYRKPSSGGGGGGSNPDPKPKPSVPDGEEPPQGEIEPPTYIYNFNPGETGEQGQPEQDGQPSQPVSPNEGGSPRTGDDSQIMMYFVMLTGSLGLMILVILWKRKEDDSDEEMEV